MFEPDFQLAAARFSLLYNEAFPSARFFGDAPSSCNQSRYTNNVVLDDGRDLVRLVPDAPVVRHGDPAAARDIAQPDIVRAIWCKVIGVTLYVKSCVAQDGRKLQAKIAIGEEDNTQATRS
jgi:hypothetical protein